MIDVCVLFVLCSVVVCLFIVAYCLVCDVCCVLFVVRGLWFVANRPWLRCVVCCYLVVVRCCALLSNVACW